jgi:hypothetical protein
MVATVTGPGVDSVKASETAGAAPCLLWWKFKQRALQMPLTQSASVFATRDTRLAVIVNMVLG